MNTPLLKLSSDPELNEKLNALHRTLLEVLVHEPEELQYFYHKHGKQLERRGFPTLQSLLDAYSVTSPDPLPEPGSGVRKPRKKSS
jgi:hypothetical protein